MSCTGGWHELQSIRKTSWNVNHVILFEVPSSGISKSGKFQLKWRAHHSGKFAPREINPLYGRIIYVVVVQLCLYYICQVNGAVDVA